MLKLIIECFGDTAYDYYIAETLVPLRSTIRPKKQKRFEDNPLTSVRHILARCNKQPLTPKRTINPADPNLLMPLELLQVSIGKCVEDLRADLTGLSYLFASTKQMGLKNILNLCFQTQHQLKISTSTLGKTKTHIGVLINFEEVTLIIGGKIE